MARVGPRALGGAARRGEEHGSTLRFAVWVSLVVAAVRLTFVPLPLRADEGGYLLVARQWRVGHGAGEFLYGDYYVDRPPALMLLFKLAAATQWEGAIRLLAVPLAVAFVLLGARVGYLLGGASAARWSSVLAGALVVSPALAADQADGGLLATPFVLAAMVGAVESLRAAQRGAGSRAAAAALGAGVAASTAPLVKQSLIDGWVFAVVLLLLAAASGSIPRLGPRVAMPLLAGGAVPFAAAAAWAHAEGASPGRLWAELAAVRNDALEVIWSGHLDRTLVRAAELAALAVLSGLILVLVAATLDLRRARRGGSRRSAARPEGAPPGGDLPALRRTVGLATAVAAGYGVAAMALGGSYWLHYLLQIAPVAVLATAVSVSACPARWTRGAVWWTAGATGAALLVLHAATAMVPWTGHYRATGDWLARSSRPGDTAFVAYGNPAILEYAAMGSPYPYLWSVPMRTLDPDLSRLERLLGGPRAPAWLIEVNPWNSWQIDADGSLRERIAGRYRVVAEICGSPVWLRADLNRSPASLPRC